MVATNVSSTASAVRLVRLPLTNNKRSVFIGELASALGTLVLSCIESCRPRLGRRPTVAVPSGIMGLRRGVELEIVIWIVGVVIIDLLGRWRRKYVIIGFKGIVRMEIDASFCIVGILVIHSGSSPSLKVTSRLKTECFCCCLVFLIYFFNINCVCLFV